MDTVRRSIRAPRPGRPQKGVSALATIGSTAPFVRLLGTSSASSTRSGHRRGGSAGLASVDRHFEALIETALRARRRHPRGLVASARIENFNVEMDAPSSRSSWTTSSRRRHESTQVP
jgi:hypothetical protein